ncbi:hypothetical protein [Furfurilactobacillus cerevisiae]
MINRRLKWPPAALYRHELQREWPVEFVFYNTMTIKRIALDKERKQNFG